MPRLGSHWLVWALGFVLLSFYFVWRVSSISGDDDVFLRLEYSQEDSLHRGETTDQKKASSEASRVIRNKRSGHLKARNTRSITNDSTTDNYTASAGINATKKLLILTRVLEIHTAPPPLATATANIEATIASRTNPQPESNCGSKVYSCSNKCKENTTYNTFSYFNKEDTGSDCYCDQSCDVLFRDCCSDYKEFCPTNSKLTDADDFYKRKGKWRCTTMNIDTGECLRHAGLWMVTQCPSSWQNDDVRTKCHNPASTLDAHSLLLYLPVAGLPDLLTYRNQYCALCNNVSKYEFWTLLFKPNAIPPPFYTPDYFAEFIGRNYHLLDGIRPNEGQRIRWCTYSDIVSTCPDTTLEHGIKNCVQGTVGLVKDISSNTIFKNTACASCNGYDHVCGVSEGFVHPCVIGGSSISRAISLRNYGVSVTTKSCKRNEVYDTFLEKCRQTYAINKLHSGSADEYQVTMSIFTKNSGGFFISRLQLKNSLSDYFRVNKSQINDIKVNVILDEGTETRLTFNIKLTQAQSLILASDSKLNGSSNETTTLRRLFRFKKVFQLPNGVETLTIYRQEIRQVVCTRPHLYQYGEYILLEDLEIRILSTGAIYQQFEYYMNSTVENAPVTVCLKTAPRDHCNGSYIKLNSSEFYFTSNLTLVYNSLVYDFGDYVYNNSMVYICVNFEREYETTDSNALEGDLPLVILTWIGFIVSSIGLLVLFITYAIFKELRSLPGKNLMSLSISLCLAEVFWIVGSTLDNYPTACTAVAIANHYFFLAFFAASSVIAFHSCLVFGRKMAIRRSQSEDNKIFIIYFLVTWAMPGLFLLIFGLLDHHGVFIIDYGKSVVCWLGTKESKIFLFILPFGILLLFNLILFIIVALRLHKNQKSSARALGKDAKKRELQNVKVCVKLSTLMGFSWLFGLLQVAMETETDAFAYLFVIFVSVQGLFICVAFLFQRKCYNLYNTLISKSFSSSKGSSSAETPSNDRRRTRDTKL